MRRAIRTDWPVLENSPPQDLGAEVIKLLASRVEDKKDITHLNQQDWEALGEADLKALATAISSHNKWDELPADAGLQELGEKVAAAVKKERDRSRAVLEEMRKSIDSSYSFLGNTTLDKLQKQMENMSKIHQDIFNPDVLGIAGRFANVLDEPVVKPKLDYVNVDRIIPNIKDTPLGRATLEGVENTRKTAEKMDNLAVVVAELNQTLIKDVLPAWFKNVKEGQLGAEKAAKQAAKSLGWTKWAVIVSVAVTMLATFWQVDVSKTLDKDSSAQQARAEGVLREQLQSQRELIEHQKQTQQLLRDQIAELQMVNENQALNEDLLRKQIADQRRLYEQNSRSQAAVLKAIAGKAVSPPASAPK